MSAPRPAPTAALRGGAVGALAAALAVAAHGVAGGGFPGRRPDAAVGACAR
ncbi:hypothetical protein GTA09_17300 [Rhodococcus hoagii]|nr:hypothetical protein [Prescottella equi]